MEFVVRREPAVSSLPSRGTWRPSLLVGRSEGSVILASAPCSDLNSFFTEQAVLCLLATFPRSIGSLNV